MGGYGAQLVLPAIIWLAAGVATGAILGPSKAPASPFVLRVRSVFLKETEVSCVLGADWGAKLG